MSLPAPIKEIISFFYFPAKDLSLDRFSSPRDFCFPTKDYIKIDKQKKIMIRVYHGAGVLNFADFNLTSAPIFFATNRLQWLTAMRQGSIRTLSE